MVGKNLDKLQYKKFFKIKLSPYRCEQYSFFPRFTLFGLKLLRSGNLTAKQIEASRLIIRRFFKKKVWFKFSVFPFTAVTKKSTGSRMGKGKGKHFEWLCPVLRGRVILEVAPKNEVSDVVLRRKVDVVLNNVTKKIPIKARPAALIY